MLDPCQKIHLSKNYFFILMPRGLSLTCGREEASRYRTEGVQSEMGNLVVVVTADNPAGKHSFHTHMSKGVPSHKSNLLHL